MANRDLWEILLGLLHKYEVSFRQVESRCRDGLTRLAHRLATKGVTVAGQTPAQQKESDLPQGLLWRVLTLTVLSTSSRCARFGHSAAFPSKLASGLTECQWSSLENQLGEFLGR